MTDFEDAIGAVCVGGAMRQDCDSGSPCPCDCPPELEAALRAECAKQQARDLEALKAEVVVRKVSPTGGQKDVAGKPPLALVPRALMVGVAHVLAFGARKYAVHNWRKGLCWTDALSACLRHLYAWNESEDLDPETGFSHLWHAGCELAFLIDYEARSAGTDDRWRPEPRSLPARHQCPSCGWTDEP